MDGEIGRVDGGLAPELLDSILSLCLGLTALREVSVIQSSETYWGVCKAHLDEDEVGAGFGEGDGDGLADAARAARHGGRVAL